MAKTFRLKTADGREAPYPVNVDVRLEDDGSELWVYFDNESVLCVDMGSDEDRKPPGKSEACVTVFVEDIKSTCGVDKVKVAKS